MRAFRSRECPVSSIEIVRGRGMSRDVRGLRPRVARQPGERGSQVSAQGGPLGRHPAARPLPVTWPGPAPHSPRSAVSVCAQRGEPGRRVNPVGPREGSAGGRHAAADRPVRDSAGQQGRRRGRNGREQQGCRAGVQRALAARPPPGQPLGSGALRQLRDRASDRAVPTLPGVAQPQAAEPRVRVLASWQLPLSCETCGSVHS